MEMKHILYILLSFVGFAVMTAACDDSVAYDKYKPTQAAGWYKGDTVVFDVPRLRQAGSYGQNVGLRVTADYPFTALSIAVERVVEPGHRRYCDTLSCRVYDDEGNIIGRGVSKYQYDIALPDITLSEGDSMHVSVRHLMRRETMPGISDVGFRLTRK